MLTVPAQEAGHVLALVDTPAADATWRSDLTRSAGSWARRAQPRCSAASLLSGASLMCLDASTRVSPEHGGEARFGTYGSPDPPRLGVGPGFGAFAFQGAKRQTRGRRVKRPTCYLRVGGVVDG